MLYLHQFYVINKEKSYMHTKDVDEITGKISIMENKLKQNK